MSEQLKDPLVWAQAIFLVVVGIALSFRCSGIGEDPILRGCESASKDGGKVDKLFFLECVKLAQEKENADD
jgi:hypothetical protein